MTPTQSLTEGVITKGVGGAYTVHTPDGVFICNARGVFRNRNVTPVIGDYVEIAVVYPPDGSEATGTIQTVKPRRNELPRPRVANVDLVIVTMAAADPDFNTGLLDRYLMLAEHAGIDAAVCVNKSDLSPEAAARIRLYADAGYETVLSSANDGSGTDTLRALFSQKIAVFAGPSGVGKSSLINRLIPEAARETGRISEKIKRGRHTTRHTEILPIPPDGFCVDTPGFTSLDLSGIPVSEYAALFREFKPYVRGCRFSNCMHITEDGCAVKDQIGQAIRPERYDSYLNIVEATLRGVR